MTELQKTIKALRGLPDEQLADAFQGLREEIEDRRKTATVAPPEETATLEDIRCGMSTETRQKVLDQIAKVMSP